MSGNAVLNSVSSIDKFFFVGTDPGSRGTFSISGSAVAHMAGGLVVGNNSADGVVNHSGGTIGASWVDVGENGTGNYNLSGGTLNTLAEVVVGRFGGNGTMTITGGSLGTGVPNAAPGIIAPAPMHIGRGSIGHLFMSGGSVNTTSEFVVGLTDSTVGAGTASVSGGVITSAGAVIIGRDNSRGVLNLSGSGIINANSGFAVAPGTGGIGAVNQSGGTANIVNSIVIGRPDGTGSGSYAMSAGALNAAAVPLTIHPNSSFVQSGGVATVGPVVAAAGSIATIGGGAGPATFNFDGMTADALTVANNGTAIQKVAGSPLARDNSGSNVIGALSISGGGLLDIGNRDLRLDSTRTPDAVSFGYWRQGYNNDPNGGFGLSDGNKGMSSSVAVASAQSGDPNIGNARITVGYLFGAAQAGLGANYEDLGGPHVGANETLFRPALMGDLNLDGIVDGNDIGLIVGLGYYGKTTAPEGWLDGDLNGDGIVDGNDIGLIVGTGTYNNGSYGVKSKSAKSAAATLSGSDAVASTTVGTPGDGKMDYVYDPVTGDVKVLYDGDTRIDAANGHPLQRLRLASAAGKFRTTNLNTSGFATATDTNTLLDCAQTAGAIPDGYDLGAVLPVGLTDADLIQDLTLNWQVQSGGVVLKAGDVVVPEPTTLGLIGVGAMGLLARRRKR